MTVPTNTPFVPLAQEFKPRSVAGMKAVLAIPSYGTLNPRCEKSVRYAMMVASNAGLKWGGDLSLDRYGWSAARSGIATQFYENPQYGDGILWVDSDMDIPPDSFVKMIGYGKDFVGAVYHQRVFPHNPSFHVFDPQTGLWKIAANYPDDVFAKVDGMGFGLVWTGRPVFETIANNIPGFDKELWFPDKRDAGGGGEDLEFCKLARNAGVDLYVDTGLQPLHMGDPVFYSKADWVKANVQIPKVQ